MNTLFARFLARRMPSGLVRASFAMTTLSVTLLAQTLMLAPGNYEKTTETSTPGRPARPALKGTVCLGEDDVRDLSKVAAKVADDKVTCKVSDYKVTSATVTFTKSCPVPGGNTLVFDVTMTVTSPDSYRGTMTVKSSGLGVLPAGLTTTTTARRIGTCSK